MLSLWLIPVVILWGGLALAARRFERRRMRDGAWNERGPKDPTFAPPNPDLRGYAIDPPTIPSLPETDAPTPTDSEDR